MSVRVFVLGQEMSVRESHSMRTLNGPLPRAPLRPLLDGEHSVSLLGTGGSRLPGTRFGGAFQGGISGCGRRSRCEVVERRGGSRLVAVPYVTGV